MNRCGGRDVPTWRGEMTRKDLVWAAVCLLSVSVLQVAVFLGCGVVLAW